MARSSKKNVLNFLFIQNLDYMRGYSYIAHQNKFFSLKINIKYYFLLNKNKLEYLH